MVHDNPVSYIQQTQACLEARNPSTERGEKKPWSPWQALMVIMKDPFRVNRSLRAGLEVITCMA